MRKAPPWKPIPGPALCGLSHLFEKPRALARRPKKCPACKAPLEKKAEPMSGLAFLGAC